jgi:feruloyl-CoA synthase
VICTQANLALNGAQIAACFAPDAPPPVVVNGAPWSHSLGGNALLHGTTHQGGTLHIDRGQPTAGRFVETLALLNEVRPTYHNMVPAGWPLLAEALERDPDLARRYFSEMRVLQYGGAGLAQSTMDRITALAVAVTGERITFAAGYGATETGPTACNIHWLNDRTGIVGLPVPGTEAKLVPAPGGKQELRIRGPQVSPGYLDDPELTAAAFDEEGFYRLGMRPGWSIPATLTRAWPSTGG